jgi:nucleoid-associated protein YgaU
VVAQELEIPYVTFRYQVKAGDTKKKLALNFYNDTTMREVYEIPNGAAQRDLIVGEWLLIPDLANVGHHTVVAGETLEILAERWYGESRLWTIISIANHLPDEDPAPGTVLMQPRLNRKHTVVAGCHAVEAGRGQLRRRRRRSHAHTGEDGCRGQLHR